MVSIPTEIDLYSTGGAQVYQLGGEIITTHYPLQGLNYMYAQGNRRTLLQMAPASPVTGAVTIYDRVPIKLTPNKTSVTIYGYGKTSTLHVGVYNSGGTPAGSGVATLTFGASASVQTATITGLTVSTAVYVRASSPSVGSIIYMLQFYEGALAALP